MLERLFDFRTFKEVDAIINVEADIQGRLAGDDGAMEQARRVWALMETKSTKDFFAFMYQ